MTAAETRDIWSERELLTLCDAYRKTMRIGDVRLGRLASNDQTFFRRLRSGGTCTLRKSREAVQWFSDWWPHGVAWPRGIPRPAPSPGSLARKEAA